MAVAVFPQSLRPHRRDTEGLRSKMGEKGNYIKTIWGMGYKFEADES